MKHFIKMAIALILGVVALGFQSCGSDDDEPDAKVYATVSDIQGTWHGTLNGFYYRFTFDGDNYSYNQMNVADNDITASSNGTFTIKDHKIIFSGGKNEVPWSDEEIFWTNSMKNYLQIGQYLSLFPGK